MSLSREEILNAKEESIVKISVPEWSGEVCIKCLSGFDRDRYETMVLTSQEKKNYENLRAKLLVMTLCDDEGNKLFTEKDINELGKKSAKVLDRLFNEAQKVSGLSKSDLEELQKN